MTAQINQYTTYVRYEKDAQPVQISVEAANMDQARIELQKWMKARYREFPYLYQVKKLRRAYKNSTSNIFHPTDSTLTVVNK